MASLDDIARDRSALGADDVDWLHALVADWQIIADIAFADLVLWLPDVEANGLRAAAQIRPTTGPTTLIEDVVGAFVPGGAEVLAAEGVQVVPVRREALLGHVVVRSARGAGRAASALEEAYQDAASIVFDMIGRGQFPLPGRRSELADSLRVGDGFVRTDAGGRVQYASPNAQSAYRRLGLAGDLVGARIGAVTTALVDRRPTDRGPLGLFDSTEGGESDLENAAASLMVRVIPLRHASGRAGSLILLRDVTELRLRERELVSKEATIREIHHRVKNNLQTVAALLRLQGRRSDLPEARDALEDAERRVASIALVHDTLSRSFGDVVDFDEVADSLLRRVIDLGDAGGGRIRRRRIGSFGSFPGSLATPLAMVLTELVQNAATHAFDGPGTVTVTVNRIRGRLRLRVSDDGRGLPADFDASSSLGLSIVTTLVDSELHGSLSFDSGPRGGTTVTIAFQLA